MPDPFPLDLMRACGSILFVVLGVLILIGIGVFIGWVAFT